MARAFKMTFCISTKTDH